MQPTPPGWYWDPGNQPGLFRWWDGNAWTEHTSLRRSTDPPPTPPLPGPDPDGRYRAGGLSYPALAEPWRRCPGYPDLDDVVGQELVVGKTPRGPYIAGVFIGGLPSRYAYSAPDDLDVAGRALAHAMLTTYYPHESPRRDLEPTLGELDNHRCWRAVVTLEVDDPNLSFQREYAAFVVVDLDGRAGACYASLPELEHVPDAEKTLADLHVA